MSLVASTTPDALGATRSPAHPGPVTQPGPFSQPNVLHEPMDPSEQQTWESSPLLSEPQKR